MLPHRKKHIDEWCSREHEWHYIGRQASVPKCEDDANCSCRAERSSKRSRDRTLHRKAVKTALRRQAGNGNQNTNQEVSDSDTEQRAHRVPQLDLSVMQCRTIQSP